MANENMIAIQTVTVGAGGAAQIEFTSIPQTYTDLVVRLSVRTVFSSDVADDMLLKINGSTSGFSNRYIYGNGSNAFSANAYGNFVGSPTAALATANTFGSIEVYIPNYTGSNQKSYSVNSVSENNGTAAIASMIAGLNTTTSAISSLAFYSVGSNNFVQYSTATLYGVTSYTGGTGGKAVGGTVTSDSTYWYHTFTTSGMFKPTQALTADFVVIAGAGGGGGPHGGGGGAGGLLNYTSQSLSSGTNYTVLVGAGGSAGVSTAQGGNGSNSQFGSTTAATGGGGGGYQLSSFPYSGTNGSTGGSGGGGAGGGSSGASGGSGAAGTAGQGNAGGNGKPSGGDGGGGGGGGAGATGSSTSGSQGGDGGAGTSSYSSWGSATSTGQNSGGTYYYGGGGGGGSYVNAVSSPSAGGLGGGGNGGYTSPSHSTVLASVAGSANTGGGGGGGAGNGGNGSAGGSGIVIVRYAK